MYCRGVHEVGSSERRLGGDIPSTPAQKASVQGCIEALLTLLVGVSGAPGIPLLVQRAVQEEKGR